MGKIRLDFDILDPDLRGKIVKGSIIPRPIAWISSLNEIGTINLAPFSFFNMISPTIVAVSFQKSDIKMKDTFINIMREKEAVIHIVSKDLIGEMDKSAAPLKLNESELDLIDLRLSQSTKINTPGIREALIRFEVRLDKSISLLNYEGTKEEADLVILRIVGVVIDDKVFDSENNYILPKELNPVSRLAGANYSALDILDFKREF